MGLFRDNFQNDAILASEYLKVLSVSGIGAETMAVRVGSMRFGRISRFFRDAAQGKVPLRDALEAQAKSGIHPYLKKLSAAVLSGKKKDFDTVIALAKKDKTAEAEIIARRLDTTTTWLVLLPLAPVAILLIDYLEAMFIDMPDGSPITFSLPEEAKAIILILCGLTAALLAFANRVKQ